MKRILRLDEDDIVKILKDKFDVRSSKVTSYYTDIQDEVTGETETKFYVEIEQDER